MLKIKKPETKNKILAIALTPTDHDRIKKIANKYDVSMGSLARSIILQQIDSNDGKVTAK